MRLCFWARSSPAPACHLHSPGTEAELTTGGKGDSLKAKSRRNQSFRSRLYLGRSGAGGGGEERRRQRMTATPRQLANSQAPGSATAVSTRSALRLSRVLAAGWEQSSGGRRRGGEGQRATSHQDRARGHNDLRASQDKTGLGNRHPKTHTRSPNLRKE